MVLSDRARRDLADVPPRIVPAIVEFAFGELAIGPRSLGKSLRRDLTGCYAARRGPYRLLYDIDDDADRVTILRVEHRLPQQSVADSLSRHQVNVATAPAGSG